MTSHMQDIFPEYGWTDALVSDTCPYYNACELEQAVEDMGVHHITSSPHYHQSNGYAE